MNFSTIIEQEFKALFSSLLRMGRDRFGLDKVTVDYNEEEEKKKGEKQQPMKEEKKKTTENGSNHDKVNRT